MLSENPTLSFFRRLANPVIVISVLIIAALYYGERLDGYYLVLGVIAFFLSSHLFDDLSTLRPCGRQNLLNGFGSVMFAWLLTICAIVFLGYATRLDYHFETKVIQAWFILTPVGLLLGHLAIRWYIQRIHNVGRVRHAVIIGANDLGMRLAGRLENNECLLTDFLGFFDERRSSRLSPGAQEHFLGHLADLQEFLRKKPVDVVYIALPISQKERVSYILDMLKDTTVSVYLVPDIYTFDLIQARIDLMGGIPVIAILETPFTSINAFNKRMLDVLFSIAIMLMISPVLLVCAIAVKLSSPGPVIFRQRRYGLNGEEILVYKFRSMRVCEDGAVVKQATRDDDRITSLGRFLRRTSLDELPQFINVIQGRMSIVGPRPHAVAHNEQYRKLISGYMLRHKAKPGITGWAQVNGLRGETDTVDKMAARVQYDLDYLRNWSLSLDLLIIFKTIWLVFKDARAY